jgi:hypothetical protein
LCTDTYCKVCGSIEKIWVFFCAEDVHQSSGSPGELEVRRLSGAWPGGPPETSGVRGPAAFLSVSASASTSTTSTRPPACCVSHLRYRPLRLLLCPSHYCFSCVLRENLRDAESWHGLPFIELTTNLRHSMIGGIRAITHLL